VIRPLLAGILLGLFVANPATANHSLPAPAWWWDLDNDKIADEADSNIGYGRVGALWTQEKIADLTWLLGEWRGRTHWDPFNATDQGGVVRATYRVDGVHPCGGTWTGVDVAVTCISKNSRFEGGVLSFYDIFDADTGINLAQSWNYGGDAPNPTQFDFRSNGVHESGHGILLKDIFGDACGNPVISMCSGLGPGMPGGTRWSLEADDISSADVVYPQ
jgi:hypothetical protein